MSFFIYTTEQTTGHSCRLPVAKLIYHVYSKREGKASNFCHSEKQRENDPFFCTMQLSLLWLCVVLTGQPTNQPTNIIQHNFYDLCTRKFSQGSKKLDGGPLLTLQIAKSKQDSICRRHKSGGGTTSRQCAVAPQKWSFSPSSHKAKKTNCLVTTSCHLFVICFDFFSALSA